MEGTNITGQSPSTSKKQDEEKQSQRTSDIQASSSLSMTIYSSINSDLYRDDILYRSSTGSLDWSDGGILQPGPSQDFLAEDECYTADSPLVLAIRRKLGCDGFTLKGSKHEAYKMKVVYEVLKSFGINTVIETEDGPIEVDSIKTNALQILRDHATNIPYYSKESMLTIKEKISEDYKMELSEYHFVELMVKWINATRPAESDLSEVYESVKWGDLCRKLQKVVMQNIGYQGYQHYRGVLELDLLDVLYKHESYRWYRSPLDFEQLIRQGYLKLCKHYNSRECKINNCDKMSHPCYTLTIQDNYYIVRDSEECSEGGHVHKNSVMCYWMQMRHTDIDKGFYLSVSLVLNNKEDVDNILQEADIPFEFFDICIMYDPQHTD